jgi:hypothetical protein
MTMQATNDGAMLRMESRDIGRLSWIGLTIAGIGWIILLGEATVVDILPIKATRPVSPTFHADLCDIAKCLIASGFGLAVVGALQTGFGALNRFFEAVLMRSSQRAAPPAPTVVREAPPVPPAERTYRRLPDGSVEVETILGTRRFKTMAEARDFI